MKGKRSNCRAISYSPDLGGLFHGRHLGVGAKLTVETSQPGRIGKAYVFTIRARRQPATVTTCLAWVTTPELLLH